MGNATIYSLAPFGLPPVQETLKAMLETGNMVMERIKRLFYRKYPNSNVTFSYRVGPISTEIRVPYKRSEAVQNEE